MKESMNNHITRLENENKRLKVAVEELTILNDISTAISSTSSLERIMELIVQKCIKHVKTEQGAVMLLDIKEKEGAFRTMIRGADTSQEVLPFRLDTQLTGWMIKNKQPLLVNDLKKDERFQVGREECPICSLLSVPLLLKGRMIGTLNVFNKRTEEGFNEGDKRLLMIIATQSAQIIENARLYEEEQALRLMQEEMRMAYQIQMDLLPKEAPEISGYDIAGKSIPAKAVGGDYFDFIEIDKHRLAFCLADVVGKGMPAALLMSNLQATLRGQVLQKLSPKECVKRSNALLFRSTDDEKFATLFYGILNNKKNHLDYCNAGHCYPYLFKASEESMRLDVGGLVIGAFEEFDYSEDAVSFDPGDILLIFSDGITEAVDQSGEQYTEERLYNVIQENRNASAEQLIENIIESVKVFTGESSQVDDMTLIVMKRGE